MIEHCTSSIGTAPIVVLTGHSIWTSACIHMLMGCIKRQPTCSSNTMRGPVWHSQKALHVAVTPAAAGVSLGFGWNMCRRNNPLHHVVVINAPSAQPRKRWIINGDRWSSSGLTTACAAATEPQQAPRPCTGLGHNSVSRRLILCVERTVVAQHPVLSREARRSSQLRLMRAVQILSSAKRRQNKRTRPCTARRSPVGAGPRPAASAPRSAATPSARPAGRTP